MAFLPLGWKRCQGLPQFDLFYFLCLVKSPWASDCSSHLCVLSPLMCSPSPKPVSWFAGRRFEEGGGSCSLARLKSFEREVTGGSHSIPVSNRIEYKFLRRKRKIWKWAYPSALGVIPVICITQERRVSEAHCYKSTLFSSTQNKVILVVAFNSQDTSVLPQLVI